MEVDEVCLWVFGEAMVSKPAGPRWGARGWPPCPQQGSGGAEGGLLCPFRSGGMPRWTGSGRALPVCVGVQTNPALALHSTT